MRILIVEDYAPTRDAINRELRADGHAVDATADGEEGLWFARQNRYDIILLDLMLPNISGWEILKRLRELGDDAQIIILTAQDSVEDRVRGLDEGADDYVVKPFAMEEIRARVRASGRRLKGIRKPVIKLKNGLTYDTVRREAFLDGQLLDLTPKELSLLEYFVMRVGQLVTRTDIWESVYDFHSKAQSNVADVYVGRLRRKLKRDGQPSLIVTRRGQGYLLEDCDDEVP